MYDIKWADPPPDGRTRTRPVGRRQQLVSLLRVHHGRWAQYSPERGHWASNASAFKRDFPGVEVTTRLREDGKYDIYVRWVGNGDAP